MRGLLVTLGFFALIFFMMPFILSVVGFVLLFALVFLLLARLGLIPGMTYRRTTYTTTSRKPPRAYQEPQTKTVFWSESDATPPRQEDGGWFQSDQEGEIITLPETALKKDDGESPPSS